jgi:Holliday junction resolvase RusA-like endonuclease
MDRVGQDSGTLALGDIASEREGERLQFVLPSFPVSFNRLYDINHRQRRVYLSDDAALWKTHVIPFVRPCRWPCEWLLKVTLEYQSPSWLTKQGKLRRVDVQNLDKLTIDLMFAKWGWDDSRLVEIVTRKRYGPREQVQVTLERVELELGGG